MTRYLVGRAAPAAVLLCLVVGAAFGQVPGQPHASYWQPDSAPNSLLTYNLANDPDAQFNRGSIPLASRHFNPAVKANSHARNEARVMSLAAFSDNDNPSQGSSSSRYYAFTHWQYLDALVDWGGAAGVGNIVPPPGPVIDAAHRNGVPVYGTIFFPPSEFGGTLDPLEDMVRKAPDGSFPLADKLIEVARHNRFDGYFVNQETQGASAALATQTREFLQYIQAHSDLKVVWYDAMIESGPVSWQGALNTQNDSFFQNPSNLGPSGLVSDSMFLDFRWNASSLASSATKAEQLRRSRYDLYAGVNVEGPGWDETGEPLSDIFPEGQPHRMSMAFYRPEWTEVYAGNITDSISRESRFWDGANGNPANTSGTVGNAGWKGVAHYITERSAVSDGPFVTHFNIGRGQTYYYEGRTTTLGTWNNLSLQDVMPTWQWRMTAGAAPPLAAEFDLQDAFYGGSSLRVAGNLVEKNDLQLYMTSLPVTAGTNFQIAYHTSAAGAATNMQVLLAFEDAPNTLVALPLSPTGTGRWDLETLSLAPYAGRTIAQIGLRFNGQQAGYDMNVGRLAVIEGLPDPPAPAKDLQVQQVNTIASNRVSLRLNWEHSTDYAPDATNNIYYYNLIHVLPNGRPDFLGGTPNNAFFVDNLTQVLGETLARLDLVSVSNEFGQSSKRYYFDWTTRKGVVDGDVNRDDLLNDGDVLAFINSWMSVTSSLTDVNKWKAGDLNLDGMTNQNDLQLFRTAVLDADIMLSSTSLAALNQLTVPEPATWALAAIGMGGLILRSRR